MQVLIALAHRSELNLGCVNLEIAAKPSLLPSDRCFGKFVPFDCLGKLFRSGSTPRVFRNAYRVSLRRCSVSELVSQVISSVVCREGIVLQFST
jgi:hypothetical protein